jgi:hypothetical protein
MKDEQRREKGKGRTEVDFLKDLFPVGCVPHCLFTVTVP